MSNSKHEGLLGKTFNAWRSQPRVWFWLSLSSLPLVFFRFFLNKELSSNPFQSLILILPTEILCFTILFLFWCMAALAFDMEKDMITSDLLVLWRDSVSRERGFFLRLAVWFWLYEYLYRVVVSLPFFIGMFVWYFSSGDDYSNIEIMSTAIYFITDFLSAFLIMRICLVPQLAMLAGREGKERTSSTVRESIGAVKQDYLRVLPMFLLPWVLGSAGIFLISLGYEHLARSSALDLLFLIVAACLEGGRISFIAAGYNEYYKEVLR